MEIPNIVPFFTKSQRTYPNRASLPQKNSKDDVSRSLDRDNLRTAVAAFDLDTNVGGEAFDRQVDCGVGDPKVADVDSFDRFGQRGFPEADLTARGVDREAQEGLNQGEYGGGGPALWCAGHGVQCW